MADDSLEHIATEVRQCQACQLCTTRNKAVPGEGNPQTAVLFIGEGPGMNEDRQGRPFIGAAGQFLDEMLASVGLQRSDCFITNVVKCRPPNNRDPEPQEIAACNIFLDRQIVLLHPKLIVTLGRFSMAKFFPGETISRIHGKIRNVDGQMVLPLYHPAAALHQGALRKTLLEDFKQVPLAVAAAKPELQQQRVAIDDLFASVPSEAPKTDVTNIKDEEPPQQMLLF